ncbi:Bcr/CflA family efflux MFS transporter [Nonomuraea angiospora]
MTMSSTTPASVRAAVPAQPRHTRRAVMLLLSALTGLGPLSMDLYLPALPAVTAELRAQASVTQLSVTACLAGLALGQLLIGPLSDRWGRRRPLLAGLACYAAATLACALAPTAALLIAARLAQGLAAAAGIVIARAVLTDLHSDGRLARALSTLAMISGVAPVLGPVFGGQLLRLTDWRGVFAVLATAGLALALLSAWAIPETLPANRRHTGGLTDTLRPMRALLGDRRFAGALIAYGLISGTLFVYVAGFPFVVQDTFGASAQTFSLIFGCNAAALIMAAHLNSRLVVGRIPLDRAVAVGLTGVLAAVLALLALVTPLLGGGLAAVAASQFAMMFFIGVIAPNVTALAMGSSGDAAGSASALIGAAQFLTGALTAPLAGLGGPRTGVSMAAVEVGCAALALAAFLLMRRAPASGPA